MIRRHKWPLIAAIVMMLLGLVWFLMTGPRPMMLPGQAQIVGFSADGRALATIDQDGKACLWDLETGQSRNDLAGELADLPLPFSPDGRYRIELEAANRISERILVDLKTGESILRFRYAMHYPMFAFGFTPDSRYFYTPISDSKGNFTGTGVWSLPDGNQVYLGKMVAALAMSPDGEHLAIATPTENRYGNKLEIFSIREGVVDSSFDKLDLSSYPRVAFSSAGDRIVVCWDWPSFSPCRVKVLDIQSKRVLAEHEPGRFKPFQPRFIQKDQLIAVHKGSDTGPVAICLAETDHESIAWNIDALALHHLWGVTAAKARDELSEWFEINVFKISSDHVPRTTNESPFVKLKFPIDQWGYPPRGSIPNDGERVAVTFQYGYSESPGMSNSTRIAVVDVPSKQVILSYRSKDHAHNVHFSPDGRFIAFENSVLSPGVGVIRIPDQN